MANRRKGAGSSEETDPETTAVVLSKTTSPVPNTSASGGAAACPSPTPTGFPSFDGDWHKAFQVLSAALGQEMLGSDLLILVAYNLRDKLGEEVAREFLRCLRMNRSSFINNFMG